MIPSSPTRQHRSALAIRQLRADKVPDLLNELVVLLTDEKPADPLQRLIDALEAKTEAERAVYYAPPALSPRSSAAAAAAANSASAPPSFGDAPATAVAPIAAFRAGAAAAAACTVGNVPPSPIGTPRGTRSGPNSNTAGKVCIMAGFGDDDETDNNNSGLRKAPATSAQEAGAPMASIAASPLRRDRTLIGTTQTLGQEARRVIGQLERESIRTMESWGCLGSPVSGTLALPPNPNPSPSSPTSPSHNTSAVGRLVRPSDVSALHGATAEGEEANNAGILLSLLLKEAHDGLMATLRAVSSANEDVSLAMAVTGRSGGVGLLGGVMATAAAAAAALAAEEEEEAAALAAAAGGSSSNAAAMPMLGGLGTIVEVDESDEEETITPSKRAKRGGGTVTIAGAHHLHNHNAVADNPVNAGGGGARGGGAPSSAAVSSAADGGLNFSVEDTSAGGDDYSGTTTAAYGSFASAGASPRSPRHSRGGGAGGGGGGGGGAGSSYVYNYLSAAAGGAFARCGAQAKEVIDAISAEEAAMGALLASAPPLSASEGGAGEVDALLRSLMADGQRAMASAIAAVERNARLLCV